MILKSGFVKVLRGQPKIQSVSKGGGQKSKVLVSSDIGELRSHGTERHQTNKQIMLIMLMV